MVEADPAHAADAAVARKRRHGPAVAGVLPAVCNRAALLRDGPIGTLSCLGFSGRRCRVVGRRKVDKREEKDQKAEEDVEGGEIGVELGRCGKRSFDVWAYRHKANCQRR